MLPYISTKIQESITVKSIITVFKRRFNATDGNQDGEAHDFPELLFIENGSHNMSVGGKDFALSANDMLIYAPKAYHNSRKSDAADVFILSFELESKEALPIYNTIISLNLSQREALREIVDDAAKCFSRRPKGTGYHGMTLNEGVSEYRLEKIKKRLELFLLDIQKNIGTSKKKSYDDDVLKVRLFCLKNLDKHLSLSNIAKESSMSVSKLKLLFKEKYGGALNFFNDLKIEEAKRQIREENKNFTEIADSLGFSSLHYFSRLFKNKTGLSPSEYKNNKIQNEEVN